MRNTISLLLLLAVSSVAGAVELTLVADNTRSSSGTLSYQVFQACTPPSNAAGTGCSTFGSTWQVANGVTGSTATWDWDGTTLAATGTFQSTSHLSSNPAASAVISDKSVNLTINTGTMTTTATSYTCIEGNFLANVGANGCLNTSTGTNFANESSALYNVGGNANCVNRTVGGDDTSTGNVRGLMSVAGGGGCDATDGAYDLWTVVSDNTATGGQLILSNGIDIAAAGTHYMTFQAVVPAADAVDDGPVDVLEATATDINVGANDTNFTNPVTITRTTPDPTKGTAVVATGTGNAADVTITYTSNVGATGTDTFGYSITDGTNTDTATVTVNILAFGANNDSASTTRGVPVTVYPARNDAGYAPDTVTVTPGVCTSGSGTIAVTSGNGGPRQDVLVTYTPPADNPASGSTTALNDSCAYTIGNGVQPDDTANILVTVTNSVPVANDGNASAISTLGVAPAGRTATFTSPGTGGSLGNAGVTTAGNGTRGTTSVAGNVITYTVTDAAFFAGSDTFTYTVTDADGAASDEVDTGTVTVTIADVAPAITVAAITTTEDTASAARSPTITLGNGSAAQHTLAVTTDGTNGSCVLSPATTAGTVIYTPNAGYSGGDSCILTLTDGDGDAATATISITVSAAPGSSGGGSYLPGGGGALDLWGLSFLGGLAWLRRKRLA
ncbi:MAG: Ig-like domain-containing protein [Gammaproteobacteria bacterium]